MAKKFNPFTNELDLVNDKASEIKLDNGDTVEDAVSNRITIKTITFIVTAPFVAGEIIDIATGNGSISGTATKTISDTGDITSLGGTVGEFNDNASLKIVDNKSIALKGNDVSWQSATSLSFDRDLSIGEWFQVKTGETVAFGNLGNTTTDNLNVNGSFSLIGSKKVYVKTEADFPTAVAGVITLLDNTMYYVIGDIVTSNRFVMGEGTTVKGLGIFTNGLIYLGSDTMFDFLDKNATLRDINIACPAGTFMSTASLTPGVGIANIMSVNVVNCDKVGTFNNTQSLIMETVNFLDVTTTGLVVQGTPFILSLNKVAFQTGTNGIKCVDLGTAVLLKINISSMVVNSVAVNPDQVIGVSGLVNSGNINVGGVFRLDNSDFVGLVDPTTILPLENITSKDVRSEFEKNSANISDTIVFGEMFIPTSETLTISVINTPVILNDANTGGTNIWSLVDASKFTFDASLGRLTYIGEKEIFFSIIMSATIEKVGGGSDVLAGYIAKNGTVIANSRAQTQNTTPASITCQTGISLVPTDYIEVAFENQGSTSNINVNISNITIK